MNTKYIEKLEFDKILAMLNELCTTYVGKNLVNNLKPYNDKNIVYSLLRQTTEACSLIHKKNAPLFTPIINFTNISNILNSNGILNTNSLLGIVRHFKSFIKLKKLLLHR